MLPVQAYETRDGKLFKTELEALRHENELLGKAANELMRREQKERESDRQRSAYDGGHQ